jgi:hypothetical protein
MSVLAGVAGVLDLASCADFTATPGAPDAANGAGADAGETVTDGAAADVTVDAPPDIDAALCGPTLVLDFEDPIFPPPSFTTLVSRRAR